MERKRLLTADTPCDIGAALRDRYDVRLIPLHILVGEKSYSDGVDITNEEIYDIWRTDKILPKTSAINPDEYIEFFKPFVDDGYEVLHISLGSGISSCHQNARIAANIVGNVRVIDSKNLSCGFGLLVCEAGERIREDRPLDEIVGELEALVPKIRSSFVIDTLEFLHASGRCSNMAQLAAAAFKLKPSIEVLTEECGAMSSAKKYMGSIEKALVKYTTEHLANNDGIDTKRLFIVHTCPEDTIPAMIREKAESLMHFDEVHVLRAGSTIGSHCGPNTLGLMYLEK
ncbi:MAG: DegV family protein [Clostridia bacterium]|nr:DegV family protein [Clostridia bacterium]